MPGLLDVGAVGTSDLPLGLEVGEQLRVDAELLLEGLVGEAAVDADPDHGHALGLDLRLDLLVDRELVAADRAEVERVEDQEDLLAAEVGERNLLAVLIAESEIG